MMKNNFTHRLWILFCLVSFSLLQSKVLLITHSYNRPDFIEIQAKTFKKFMLDEYEFIVFNDAKEKSMCLNIEQICDKHGVRCIRIPQEIHTRPYLNRLPQEDNWDHPCIRCANVVQYSLDILGFNHNGIVAIIDSDMFLIREFSIIKYLHDYDIAGLAQSRGLSGEITYLWNGIIFLNMDTLPNKLSLNFNCGQVEGNSVDVGGHTYYYFKENPTAKLRYIEGHICFDHAWCASCKENNCFRCSHNTKNLENFDFSQELIALAQSQKLNMEIFLNNIFLHYRGGGNWDHQSNEYHEQKTKLLNIFIDTILQNKKGS